jgi:hypothetical protein
MSYLWNCIHLNVSEMVHVVYCHELPGSNLRGYMHFSKCFSKCNLCS